MDLSNIKKIYFIGIKGVAMSGLAVICKQAGFEVAGSDVAEKFITDKVLAEQGISVFENFAAANLDWRPELVVVGASWGDDNPEVAEAKRRSLPMIMESELRGQVSSQKICLAVTGVHGKTTTTALLAYILKQAGLRPSYLVGTAKIPKLGVNGHWDEGKFFVVEGDEYIKSKTEPTPKFLDLSPVITIITNLEWEHVDVYKNVAEIQKAFLKLIKKTKDLVVACVDWPKLAEILEGYDDKVITYGFSAEAEWQIADIKQESNKTIFSVEKNGQYRQDFKINLMGRHNALNALACVIVSLKLGIDLAVIKQALATFLGVERRFELSEKNGLTFIDDYAHHPTEIVCTLKTVRDKFSTQVIWCVFQAHMASRTKALLADFAKSFLPVNKVLITDIFVSAREKNLNVTGQDLAAAVKKYHADVVYTGNLDETAKYLQTHVRPGEVVVTMGAGDVYKIRDKLLSL